MRNMAMKTPASWRNMQDLSNGLDGCSVFSKVDIVKGYHQIPVAPEGISLKQPLSPPSVCLSIYSPFLVCQMPLKLSKE
jgi:hypothetical protein